MCRPLLTNMSNHAPHGCALGGEPCFSSSGAALRGHAVRAGPVVLRDVCSRRDVTEGMRVGFEQEELQILTRPAVGKTCGSNHSHFVTAIFSEFSIKGACSWQMIQLPICKLRQLCLYSLFLRVAKRIATVNTRNRREKSLRKTSPYYCKQPWGSTLTTVRLGQRFCTALGERQHVIFHNVGSELPQQCCSEPSLGNVDHDDREL